MRKLLALAILLPLAGCSCRDEGALPRPVERAEAEAPQPRQPEPEKQPATLTLATYNINRANADLAGAAETIRKSGADLVCIQEANAESEEFLTRELAEEYPHAAFRYGRRYNGFGFLSKVEIGELKLIKAVEFFNTWTTEIDFDGRPLRIVNVHLHALNPRKGNEPLQILEALRKTENIRAKEITNVCQRLNPDMPSIIIGDFNSLSGFCAPGFLKENGFIDSFASVNEDPNSHTTWHWKWKGKDLGFRIDYLFHPESLSTLESRVEKSDASDHYLLVSKLKWTPKAPE